jgi:PAS domain S-box-containing protein
VGIQISGRWQSWLFDSAFTIGAVALASLVHFALGEQFTGHTPFLVSMLAVLVSATRGGFFQGLLATFLSLILEISLWGDWRWLLPNMDSYRFIEIMLYVVEGIIISLLAAFYLNGRLALRHSQKRFQVLFDAMPVGAMIQHQNRIVAANKPFADMFGYKQHEMIGTKPTSVVAPESIEEMNRRTSAQSEESYRITGVRRNGTTFPIDVIAKNIEYQGQPMSVMVMRDLTDHLIARQRLEQMNELLEARVAERTVALNESVAELRLALENVQTLSGLLPICGSCKRIREDDGYWSQVEDYISAHSAAEFSHSLCPECLATLRDEIMERQRRQGDNGGD